jgi:hypothetical protein
VGAQSQSRREHFGGNQHVSKPEQSELSAAAVIEKNAFAVRIDIQLLRALAILWSSATT